MAGKAIDISGYKFGNLTVIRRSGTSAGGGTMWYCVCSCGNDCLRDSSSLRWGRSRSCGCLNFDNLKDHRFGFLTAIKRNGSTSGNNAKWLCRCDCGTSVTVAAYALKSGATKSCGCFQKEGQAKRATTHGLSGTPEYRVWNSMLVRCNEGGHPRYGGRGIQVCDRWRQSFQAFYSDMGPRPVGHTIERIDNDGNYEPGNCVWADRYTQAANRGLRSDNRTGVQGVSLLQNGKYSAELTVKGKKVLRGEFCTLEEAVKARLDAEKQYC